MSEEVENGLEVWWDYSPVWLWASEYPTVRIGRADSRESYREWTGTFRTLRANVASSMIPRRDQGNTRMITMTVLSMPYLLGRGAEVGWGSVPVALLPRERNLDCILDQWEAKTVPLAKQGESPDVSRPRPLHEFRPGQLFGQLEIIDTPLDGQILSRFHGPSPLVVKRN